MATVGLELIVFAVVFGAVIAAYAFGQSRRGEPGPGSLIRQYSPPINMWLEYKNREGYESLQPVKILRSERRTNGHLYLFGFNGRDKPREYRIDRISCIASEDGEVLDYREFLTTRLNIPAGMLDNYLSAFSAKPNNRQQGAPVVVPAARPSSRH